MPFHAFVSAEIPLADFLGEENRERTRRRERGREATRSICPPLLLSCYIRRDNVSSRVETQAPRPKPLSSLLFFSCPSLFLVLDAYIMVQRVTCRAEGKSEEMWSEGAGARAPRCASIFVAANPPPFSFPSIGQRSPLSSSCK